MEAVLLAQKQDNPKQIPYALSLDERLPGYFLLSCLPTKKVQTEFIKVCRPPCSACAERAPRRRSSHTLTEVINAPVKLDLSGKSSSSSARDAPRAAAYGPPRRRGLRAAVGRAGRRRCRPAHAAATAAAAGRATGRRAAECIRRRPRRWSPPPRRRRDRCRAWCRRCDAGHEGLAGGDEINSMLSRRDAPLRARTRGERAANGALTLHTPRASRSLRANADATVVAAAVRRDGPAPMGSAGRVGSAAGPADGRAVGRRPWAPPTARATRCDGPRAAAKWRGATAPAWTTRGQQYRPAEFEGTE